MAQALRELDDDRRTELEHPYWRPLLELVGDLTAWFVWQDDFRLEDGSVVHAYRHAVTRRFVYLGLDGQAYAYVPPSPMGDTDHGYRQITRVEAIDQAFLGYRRLGRLTRAERVDVERRIDAALDHAERGERMCATTAERVMRERYEAEYGDLTGQVLPASPLAVVAREA